MNGYDENKESSYINYWDMNHLYGWTINISEANYRTKHGEGCKILTRKQMLQRLPIALAEVKAGNTSENLLN